jgi:hypothetical protein
MVHATQFNATIIDQWGFGARTRDLYVLVRLSPGGDSYASHGINTVLALIRRNRKWRKGLDQGTWRAEWLGLEDTQLAGVLLHSPVCANVPDAPH